MSESSHEEEGLVFDYLLTTCSFGSADPGSVIGPSRCASGGLVHLGFTDTATTTHDAIAPVLTLSERGFRVGREMRFRQSEVVAWLVRLEAADGSRHPAEAHP